MRDWDGIDITYGDTFEVAEDDDGYVGVRIQNRAWIEAPRWLHVDIDGGDRRSYLNRLIEALIELRDHDPSATA